MNSEEFDLRFEKVHPETYGWCGSHVIKETMRVRIRLRDLLLISVAIGTMSTSVFGQAEKGTKELLFTGNVTTLFQRSTTTTVGTQVVTFLQSPSPVAVSLWA